MMSGATSVAPLFCCNTSAYALSMCKIPALLSIALFLPLTIGSVAATTIYRCVGSDGVIKFQDKPCLAAESGRRIELAEPASVSPPPVAPSPVSEAEPISTADAAPAQQATGAEPPSATLCTREDGSRYLSESGHGEQRLAPLGMLGVPNESLADAYGGPDGIGVSAPGLRVIPTDHSRHGRLGALYTWVEDPCEQASGAQLCDFLDSRVSEAERRLRLAFSDTQDSASRQLESLRRQAEQCSH